MTHDTKSKMPRLCARRVLPPVLLGLLALPWLMPAQAQEGRTPANQAEVLSQMPLVVQGTRQVARIGTAGWLERQADLRDTLAELDAEHGVWVRLAAGDDERESSRSFDVPDGEGGVAETVDLVNDYQQSLYALNVGTDLVRGEAGDSRWVAGLTAGFVRSIMRFDDSPTRVDWDSVGAGAYASYVAGDFFLDALVQSNWSALDMKTPQLDLEPDTAQLSTDAQTWSARVDAGQRVRLGPRLHLDALAGLSWARSDIDDLNVPPDDSLTEGADGDDVRFDKESSLRGSLGVRLAYAQPLDALRLTYSASARLWREFEREADAEGTLRVEDPGGDEVAVPVAFTDRFETTFRELAAGVSLASADGGLSGTFRLGGMFADGYDSYSASAAFRYQWW